MADVEAPQAKSKNADLPIRIVSAVVMIGVAVSALLAGDPWLAAFIAIVAAATLVEFLLLILKAFDSWAFKAPAILAGTAYIAGAAVVLGQLPIPIIVGVIGAVIAVDVFAYFFGRTLGGPKIAPAISPSKTWAGLLGGVVGASAWFSLFIYIAARQISGANTLGFEAREIASIIGIGAVVAVAAQAGDFLESWLKRKAGVKDSSNLIPGHGGVFDRTDGIIPVVLIAGFGLGVV